MQIEHPVARSHVSELVEQDDAQLLVVPQRRGSRKHDDRTNESPRHGNRGGDVDEESNRANDAERGSRVVEHALPPPAMHSHRATSDGPFREQTHSRRNEHREHARRVHEKHPRQ